MIDFVCIGPMRTGTTWLHERLSSTLSLPGQEKETKFFDLKYKRGTVWYQSQMRLVPGAPRGEFGPTYFHSHLARKRIAQLSPGCTIIAILREPVARLFSLYKMKLAFGTVRGSFEDALHHDPELMMSARYAFNLAAWASSFGPAQVHVLFYDSLLLDSRRFVADFCQLCGTAPPKLSEEVLRQRVNSSAGWRQAILPLATSAAAEAAWRLRFRKLLRQCGLPNPSLTFGKQLPEITPAMAACARNLLAGEIVAVEALLGIELGAWRESRPNPIYIEPIVMKSSQNVPPILR
ncbi:MAG TPA: sulfotransferase [Candidatus Binataceae bacterium]|nr:sulfotransferase [Candidatus Binataceae bacterium]